MPRPELMSSFLTQVHHESYYWLFISHPTDDIKQKESKGTKNTLLGLVVSFYPQDKVETSCSGPSLCTLSSPSPHLLPSSFPCFSPDSVNTTVFWTYQTLHVSAFNVLWICCSVSLGILPIASLPDNINVLKSPAQTSHPLFIPPQSSKTEIPSFETLGAICFLSCVGFWLVSLISLWAFEDRIHSVIFLSIASTSKGSINICDMINELIVLSVYLIVFPLEVELRKG